MKSVRRGAAYLEAGADMLFVESARTAEEVAEIPKRLPGAHLFNLPTSGSTPILSAAEVTQLGYKLMILPNFATLAAIKAVKEVLGEIKCSGSVAGILDRCASFIGNRPTREGFRTFRRSRGGSALGDPDQT